MRTSGRTIFGQATLSKKAKLELEIVGKFAPQLIRGIYINREKLRELVKTQILELRKNEEALTSSALEKHHNLLFKAMNVAYMNYEAMTRVVLGNMTPMQIYRTDKAIGREIIAMIKRLKRDKAPLDRTSVRRFEPKFYEKAVRFFGTWDAALAAAGEDPVQIKNQAAESSRRYRHDVTPEPEGEDPERSL